MSDQLTSGSTSTASTNRDPHGQAPAAAQGEGAAQKPPAQPPKQASAAGSSETGRSLLSRMQGNPWWVLVSVALGVIMIGIDGSVVAIANPAIGRDLGASLADLQ
nr:hypothetical protein [Micromonospora sp. DSM 115978]